MRFDPKNEDQLPKYGPFEPGDYDGEVIEAHDEIAKTSGAEQIHLVVRFKSDDGRTRTVHDYLHPAMEHKLRHFCVHAGLEKEYETGELCAADCQGQDVRAKLRVRRQEGYEDKNDVVDYLPRQANRPAPRPQPAVSGVAAGAVGTSPQAQAKKAFLVVWNGFVGEFPAEASSRDAYWKKCVDEWPPFATRQAGRNSDLAWGQLAEALRSRQWDPASGWKQPPQPARLQRQVPQPPAPAAAPPFSDEQQFQEADIPF